MNDAFDFVLSAFNPFGNLDFLFPRQQGNLPHLLQIHPDRVIENIEPGLFVIFLRLGLLDPIDFGLVNNLNLEVAQLDIDLVQVFRGDQGFRKSVVNVAVSEVPLLLRETNEFLNLFRQFRRVRA